MKGINSISLLCEITKLLNSSNSTDQILSEVTYLCADFLKLERLAIYSFDKSSKFVIQKAIFCRNEDDILRSPYSVNSKNSNAVDTLNSVAKECCQIRVPIFWNAKQYGLIDLEFINSSDINKGNKLLLLIIASLIAPKLIEVQRPKREFNLNNKYYKKLIDLLEKEKLYKDENLSLNSIAHKLNLSTSYLSQIVNKLSKKSFSTLINEYRIQEVTKAFQEGEHRRFSLLSIAFDAGFSSKSTFNSVFKNVLGCSPSQYIQKYV